MNTPLISISVILLNLVSLGESHESLEVCFPFTQMTGKTVSQFKVEQCFQLKKENWPESVPKSIGTVREIYDEHSHQTSKPPKKHVVPPKLPTAQPNEEEKTEKKSTKNPHTDHKLLPDPKPNFSKTTTAMIIPDSRTKDPHDEAQECSLDFLTEDYKAKFEMDLLNLGINLYHEISEEKGSDANILFSPAAVSIGLGMVYGGADASGYDNFMDVVLPLSGSISAATGYRWLKSELRRSEHSDIKFHDIDSIVIDKSLSVSHDFDSIMKYCFNTEALQKDFLNQVEQVKEDINDWVKEKTNAKIQEIIDGSRELHNNAKLIVASAFSLEGDWDYPFTTENKAVVWNGKFVTDVKTLGTDNEVGPYVDYMLMKFDEIFYHENDDVQVLGIPYRDGELVLYMFLPNAMTNNKTIKDLEAHLMEEDGTQMQEYMNVVQPEEVLVTIPKFDASSSFDLMKVLKNIGLEEGLELSKITEDHSHLKLDGAFHKSQFQVREQGTGSAEAASPNAITFPPPALGFLAVHPFVYAVRHQATGAILLMGRLVDIEENPIEHNEKHNEM